MAPIYCTFIAVSNRVEIDVILVITDEQQAEPGVKRKDGDDEEYADDVALLVGYSVRPQVRVDLKDKDFVKQNEKGLSCTCLFGSS